MRFSFLTLLSIGLLAGCKPDIPDPIWKGKHLYYSTTTTEPVCRGSFHRQEQHAVELARLLDVGLPEVIHYTRTSPPEIPDYCEGMSLTGCAYVESPYVFSVLSFHFHELSHAVANFNGIDGALPFGEGFAEVFNDGGRSSTDRVPLDEVLRDFKLETPYFYTAGLFARFLIERHGLETFVDFLRSTELDASFAQFAPVFEDVFGEPLDTAVSEFEGYPSCSDTSNRIAIVDCNLPPEPWEGKTVTLRANVACDQDDVLGPTSTEQMITTRGFEIEEAGSYMFFASAPEGWSGLRVVRCGSCWDSLEIPIEAGTMAVHDLTPGRYYALFGREVDEPAELGLVIGKP
jgi:hypothetical protein